MSEKLFNRRWKMSYQTLYANRQHCLPKSNQNITKAGKFRYFYNCSYKLVDLFNNIVWKTVEHKISEEKI